MMDPDIIRIRKVLPGGSALSVIDFRQLAALRVAVSEQCWKMTMAGDQLQRPKAWMSDALRAMKGKVMRQHRIRTYKFSSLASGANPISASLGSILRGEMAPPPVGDALGSPEVYLRHPVKGDFAQWTRLRAASADFLRPWEPEWPDDDLTPIGFRRRLDHYEKDRRTGRALPYLIFRRQDNQLVGGINVSNIRRGICQSASIGYWMGEMYARHGHMTQALNLLLPYLFEHQRLHRIEAACLPCNAASIAVLEKQGFRQEGLARSYLCINGKWEDHLLFSALQSDLRDPKPSSVGAVSHFQLV